MEIVKAYAIYQQEVSVTQPAFSNPAGLHRYRYTYSQIESWCQILTNWIKEFSWIFEKKLKSKMMRFALATEYIQATLFPSLFLHCTNIYRIIDGNTSSLRGSCDVNNPRPTELFFFFFSFLSCCWCVCGWILRGEEKKSKSIDVARRGAQVASLFSVLFIS